MNPLKNVLKLFVLGAVFVAGAAHAQLTIEITKGVEAALPIAVVPFGGEESVPERMSAIIAADLKRSGRFAPLGNGEFPDRPSQLSQVNYSTWQALRANQLAVGSIAPGGKGYVVSFHLADVYQGKELLGLKFDVGAGDLRRLSHHIADLIYEKLTGEKGAFNTRIAYISSEGPPRGETYTLLVADSDGFNPRTILRSRSPIMSPAWAPDGRRLAYVSFEDRHSQIVVQDVFTGSRQVVSSVPGINGAPGWSPDGRSLVVTLSQDGNSEIYVINATGGGGRRITNNSGIDTEGAFTPDGSSIIFTSDRGGKPQLYRVAASGGTAKRVTFEGDYNARATISPDGRYLASVNRSNGRYRIAVTDLQSGKFRILSDGSLDESPSFAPNSLMIIYASSQGGSGILSAVSVDGSVKQNISTPGGNVREPAWSPYNR